LNCYLYQVYNSPPGVSEELLVEVRSGAWRVHSAFERHMRTFASLLPTQTTLGSWAFLSPFEQQQNGEGLLG
jgi:hypothetical protein